MINAKPMMSDKFWILEEDGKKVLYPNPKWEQELCRGF
jgi:hypothetical protein